MYRRLALLVFILGMLPVATAQCDDETDIIDQGDPLQTSDDADCSASAPTASTTPESAHRTPVQWWIALGLVATAVIGAMAFSTRR